MQMNQVWQFGKSYQILTKFLQRFCSLERQRLNCFFTAQPFEARSPFAGSDHQIIQFEFSTLSLSQWKVAQLNQRTSLREVLQTMTKGDLKQLAKSALCYPRFPIESCYDGAKLWKCPRVRDETLYIVAVHPNMTSHDCSIKAVCGPVALRNSYAKEISFPGTSAHPLMIIIGFV